MIRLMQLVWAALCGVALAGAALPAYAQLASPQIEALRGAMPSAERHSRVQRFWQIVERTGTPLIEPVPGAPDRMTVTFVWRSVGGTGAPGVFGVFNTKPWDRGDPMEHVPGTDIWFRSYEMPASMRAPYLLIGPRAAWPSLRWQRKWEGEYTHDLLLDPRNKNRIADVYFRPLSYDNYFEGPAAPPEIWRSAGAGGLRGRVHELEVDSAILRNRRKVLVYQPPSSAGAPAPGLLLLFDGLSYRTPGMVPEILDWLIATGKIPPTVAVMVDFITHEHRAIELNADQRFERFVIKELVPMVRSRFGVSADPSRAIVAGASRGGLAAGAIALRHSDVFGNVIAQSAAFWSAPDRKDLRTDWLARRYVASRRLPVRFYVQPGTMEDHDDMLAPNRRFRDLLRSRGYQLCYSEFLGGHTFLHWRANLPQAIVAMTRPWNQADFCDAGANAVQDLAGGGRPPAARPSRKNNILEIM